ncbi:MAG: hypothetical protein CMF46_01640 [Legionellales bacterium]|nr:hypothetical protein [Legionellales bacterium]
MNPINYIKHDRATIYHLLPVYLVITFVYASVNISWGIVLPILFNKTAIYVPQSEQASFWFGCFASIYSLGQLLSYNVIGILSDRVGRKPIMVTTLLLFAISHVILAVSIYTGQFLWILAARFLSGLFANYINIGQSMILDYVDQSERKRFLNYYYVFANVPFALIPMFFSLTLYQNLNTLSVGGLVSPLIIIAACLVALATWIHWRYHDQYTQQVSTPVDSARHFYKQQLLNKAAIRQYTLNILIFSAMAVFYTAYPMLLLSDFNFTMESQSSVVAANNLICMTLSLLVVPKLVSTIRSETLIQSNLICVMVLTMLMSMTTVATAYLSYQLCVCLGFCLLLPLCVDAIAKTVTQNNQCKNLSINQSLKLLTKIILPPLTGYLIEYNSNLVWLLISLISLVTLALTQQNKASQPLTVTASPG